MWALGGAGLALALVAVRAGPTIPVDRAVNALSAIGFGVLSLISILFSLLFLVVQWVFTALSPRLSTFVDDPSVWRTFGVSIGVFTYSVTATLAVAARERVSVFVPLVELVSALAVVVMMRALQIKGFNTVQLGTTLRTIAVRGGAVIDQLYPSAFTDELETHPAPTHTPAASDHRLEVRWTEPPAYLQRIETDKLVRHACAERAAVVVHVGFGQCLFPGDLLAEVHAPTPDSARLLAAALPQALSVGDHRRFVQDPLLALRLSADIALRALSPAVNDPATAVQALETAFHLLRLTAGRDLEITVYRDADRQVRVMLPAPDWEEFVATALDDVIEAAAHSPLVTSRLDLELDRLEQAAPGPRRSAVQRRSQRFRQVAQNAIAYPGGARRRCTRRAAGGVG
jgi:uncharacterized membrane protein